MATSFKIRFSNAHNTYYIHIKSIDVIGYLALTSNVRESHIYVTRLFIPFHLRLAFNLTPPYHLMSDINQATLKCI